MLQGLNLSVKYIAPLALSLSTASEPIIGSVLGVRNASVVRPLPVVLLYCWQMFKTSQVSCAGYLLGLTAAPTCVPLCNQPDALTQAMLCT